MKPYTFLLLIFTLLLCLSSVTECHNTHGPVRKDVHSHHAEQDHDDDPCLNVLHGEYDMLMHIASIFIIIFVSLVGSVGPVLVNMWVERKSSSLPTTTIITSNKPSNTDTYQFAVRLGVMFGAGTMLSTGFIHMLIPAMEDLTSPCLPALWNEEYRSFAPLFAIGSILFMQFMQHVLMCSYTKNNHSSSSTASSTDRFADEKGFHESSSSPMKVPGCAHTHHHQASKEDHHHNHLDDVVSNDAKHGKRIAVVLLEVGIAVHSVIVGISLGVARSTEFLPLLIALCFHQFFEGMALGTTVVQADYKNNIKSLLLAAIYGVTTPLGIAIGIAIHSTFNPNSVDSLLVQGIFNSCSAGILIYTALVELLTPEITMNPGFKRQSVARQGLLFLAVWAGAAAMAVVGKYA